MQYNTLRIADLSCKQYSADHQNKFLMQLCEACLEAGGGFNRSNVAVNTGNKYLEVLYRHRFSKFLIHRGLRARATSLMKRIVPHLDREDRILDVGAASCTVTEWLMERDLKVVPLDVRNYSIVDSISPMLYEGKIIPFKDDHFGASLILFVLHHTHEPEKLLKEAMRVSARIIVCEDVVLSPAHKWMTSMADMLINLEFDDQPHTNKSDVEWQALFRSLGLKLLHREYRTYGLVFRHALYVVEK